MNRSCVGGLWLHTAICDYVPGESVMSVDKPLASNRL